MAIILPGVLPIISLASSPIAIILLESRSRATTEGSLSTTPLPLIYTKILAVPKSIPISLDTNILIFPPVCSFHFHLLKVFTIFSISIVFIGNVNKSFPHIVPCADSDYPKRRHFRCLIFLYYIQINLIFKGFFYFLFCLYFFYCGDTFLSQIFFIL